MREIKTQYVYINIQHHAAGFLHLHLQALFLFMAVLRTIYSVSQIADFNLDMHVCIYVGSFSFFVHKMRKEQLDLFEF